MLLNFPQTIENTGFVAGELSLIVGGERDYIVGNKAAYELAENISDCKLKIYEKYGHGAFEEAKDFNDLVLKFLV